MKDNNTPSHYITNTSLDVIDVCKMYGLNFNKGNVIKYVCRSGKKQSEINDILKAIEYLERELKYLQQ
jgi:hypothetical protein